MSRLIIPLALVVAAVLFGGAYFWATHPPAYAVSVAQVIDHHFVVAAYTVTWVVQLSYLTWLGLKWREQKRAAERLDRESR
jgi:membrane protein implicated in regulation of membrane protease activity